jgi:hypothetical protein
MDAYQKHKREALQRLRIEGTSYLIYGVNKGGGDIYVRREV